MSKLEETLFADGKRRKIIHSSDKRKLKCREDMGKFNRHGETKLKRSHLKRKLLKCVGMKWQDALAIVLKDVKVKTHKGQTIKEELSWMVSINEHDNKWRKDFRVVDGILERSPPPEKYPWQPDVVHPVNAIVINLTFIKTATVYKGRWCSLTKEVPKDYAQHKDICYKDIEPKERDWYRLEVLVLVDDLWFKLKLNLFQKTTPSTSNKNKYHIPYAELVSKEQASEQFVKTTLNSKHKRIKLIDPWATRKLKDQRKVSLTEKDDLVSFVLYKYTGGLSVTKLTLTNI